MNKILELAKKKKNFISLEIEPVQFSHQVNLAGRKYLPKKAKRFKREIQEFVRSEKPHYFEKGTPLLLWIEFGVRRPKTVKRVYPTVKPDLTNYVKLFEDALTGLWWEDDCQVIGHVTSKVYTSTPYIKASCEPWS